MATALEISIALDDLLYITGMQRSMVSNAADYQRQLAAGSPIAAVLAMQQANAQQYLTVLATRQTIRNDPQQGPMLDNGLTALSIVIADHTEAFNATVAA